MTMRKSLRLLPATAAMAAMFAFVGVPQLRADDDHKECREKTMKAESKLNRALVENGDRSESAQHAREELNKVREDCWNKEHGYWGADNTWHTQRDWDQDNGRNGQH